MIEIHRQMRAQGTPTFILSNTNDIAIGHIRRRFPFFANFDGYVFSYEHGCLKPDPKLYEVLEGLARAKGPEILFLDDKEENLVTGAARGWHVIHHQSTEATLVTLRRMNLGSLFSPE